MNETSASFWGRATQPFAASPEPEPEPLSAGDVSLSDWEASRTALGIADSGEFLGIGSWKRPTRYVHHEPTQMETYAAERASLGVREAAQASAGNVRNNASPYRAV